MTVARTAFDIVNRSTNVSVGEALGIADAIEAQVNEDFRQLWPVKMVSVRAPNRPRSGSWQVILLDDADAAGALGYHDITSDDGRPVCKVFTKLSKEYATVSSVVSHEVLEMLADPLINQAAQDWKTGLMYAYEVCDPVQDQAYRKRGVEVSNFVGPAWFQHEGWGKIDFLGSLDGPFKLTDGGYISTWDGKAWDQVYGQKHEAKPALASREHDRRR